MKGYSVKALNLIVCPTSIEFESLRKAFHISTCADFDGHHYFETALSGEHWVVYRGGLGAKKAEEYCEMAIKHWAPKELMDFGAAGALIPDLCVGDVVWGEDVIDADGTRLICNEPIPEFLLAKKLKKGLIATATTAILETKDRQNLFEKTHAVAVTWETAAISRICRDHKVKFGSLRIISDDFTTDCGLDLPQLKKQISMALEPAASALFLDTN